MRSRFNDFVFLEEARGNFASAFINNEGCESATVKQLLDNYARAITEQPSLQDLAKK